MTSSRSQTHRRPAAAAMLTLAVLTACAGPPAQTGSEDPGLVRTDLGLVRGAVDGDVRTFQDIPYAAAPEGELRWRCPQPAAPWDGVRDATQPGDICPQPAGYRAGTQSEDCLNLSVTTPATASPERPRPVLVRLDAGGLVTSGNVGVDHSPLVTGGDMVVVQPNERVGAFGFLAHPQMQDPAAGSFGIQDQQAALRWVQRNIAAFGGDPGNVTLAGLSGGGISTCASVLSPGAEGLFHRAIIQSGACDLDFPSFVPGVPGFDWVRPVDEIADIGAKLAADLGCADVEDPIGCLRGKPLGEFETHLDDVMATAHGNAVLPLAPDEALRTGRFNRVPILTGAAADEFTFYINTYFPGGVDEATYRGLIDDGTGTADRVSGQYPPAGSPGVALSSALTDRYFVLRTRQDQQALARHVPVFAYDFADRTAPVDPHILGLLPQDQVSVPYGAYHGSENQYFGSSGATFDPEQARLREQMIGYWSAFARSGDPATEGQPEWPRFDPADPVPHVQRLTTDEQGGIGPADDYSATHHLDFWNDLYPPGT